MADGEAPEGFDARFSRKLGIDQQEADARSKLENAQAASVTARSPFENALTAAQTASTNATAGTIAPLADASIQNTQAGIGEARARSGLYGAQTTGLLQGQAPIGVLGSRYFRDVLQRGGSTFAPSPAGGASGVSADPSPFQTGGSAAGFNLTPRAPSQYSPDLSPLSNSDITISGAGSGSYDVNGNYIPGHAEGTSMVMKPKKFAMGTSSVPAPGQTVTNGSWTGPVTGTPAPAPLPPTPLTGSDLRARLGLGVKAYAKGTSRVPMRGRGAPMMAGSAQTPMDPAMAPGGLPGLSGMLQAAMGASKVPGRGSGKVDTVHAMLAPGEAVVNKAGVKHIPGGRPAIAKANAKGVAEMKGTPGGAPKPGAKKVAPPPPRSMGHFQPGPPPQQVNTGSKAAR